jgi:hypothetical protein
MKRSVDQRSILIDSKFLSQYQSTPSPARSDGQTGCVLVFAGGREIRISSLELPKFYSFRAYLPRQAAGRIRAEVSLSDKLGFA